MIVKSQDLNLSTIIIWRCNIISDGTIFGIHPISIQFIDFSKVFLVQLRSGVGSNLCMEIMESSEGFCDEI